MKRLFGDVEHRLCMRHIYSNFKNKTDFKGKVLKDSIWKVARGTCMHEYNDAVEELKQKSKDAYDWLAKIDPNSRSKAHFSERAKSDIHLNNHSESFNKV